RSSDVYGLGGVLYFLVAGSSPDRRADSTLKWPRSDLPISPRLKAIVSKCLSVDQASRYSSVEELGREILRYLDGDPVLAYKENLAGSLVRWLRLNRTLVLLVLAYLLMRALVFLFIRR